MKFIHISDVYLGAQPDPGREWSENRKKELYDSFDNIIQICVKENVGLLMVAGNLFADQPTEADLQDLDERLLKLEKTRTVILCGSRDYMGQESAFRSYSFKSKTVVLPGGKTSNAYLKGINTCVTGYSYERPEYDEPVIDEISPGREGAVNILLAAGGDTRHMPFDRKKLARKGFDYVALGGSLKPAHILKDRMAYSGSLEPLSQRDTGRHGYIFGEIENGKTSIKWIPCNKRSYVNFSIDLSSGISGEELSDAIVDRIRKLGLDNIYTITYTGLVEKQPDIDLKRIINRYNIYDIIDNTVLVNDIDSVAEVHSGDLAGAFYRANKALADVDEITREKMTMYGMEAMSFTGEK
ncbi:DNA repair exonuclease SbcCD nuclease subunit [Eubacterium ruminantium]|nr:DNA repair exonuclease SbcCD nuclease subunit [Eubacterium ruminantium]